jgi:hypothetical protein
LPKDSWAAFDVTHMADFEANVNWFILGGGKAAYLRRQEPRAGLV